MPAQLVTYVPVFLIRDAQPRQHGHRRQCETQHVHSSAIWRPKPLHLLQEEAPLPRRKKIKVLDPNDPYPYSMSVEAPTSSPRKRKVVDLDDPYADSVAVDEEAFPPTSPLDLLSSGQTLWSVQPMRSGTSSDAVSIGSVWIPQFRRQALVIACMQWETHIKWQYKLKEAS